MKLQSTFATALFGVSVAKVFFKERFTTADWESKWVPSEFNTTEGLGDWAWTAGDWSVDAANKGIMTTTDMKNHVISSRLAEPLSTRGKTLVVQYTVAHKRQGTSFCGGGYLKLVGEMDPKAFHGGEDETAYKLMFGPDLCGSTGRIHLIFTDGSGTNILKTTDMSISHDDKTHLYTLVVRPDNTYEVLYDLESKAAGSLHEDWAFQKKSSDDPEDVKPADWADESQMDDPEDSKPQGHDDIPQQVPDPEAAKPDSWNDEDDGEWESPMVANPDFKGEWKARRIDNPAYKGQWAAKQVDNPKYVEDVHALDGIQHVGFDLWTVNNGTVIDNILLCDSLDYAKGIAQKVWKPLQAGEAAAKEAWQAEQTKAQEEADAVAEKEKVAAAAEAMEAEKVAEEEAEKPQEL
jgi:calreticulin